MRIAISTSVGELHGRDAIYLDRVTQKFGPNELGFSGELNAKLCSKYRGSAGWLGYELTFRNVTWYACWALERYPSERELSSSFDQVQGAEPGHSGKANVERYYVLATYDYVYEIAADGFELVLRQAR